jgi:guanylate kinase
MVKGELFIISAPSGAGKSSLIQEILRRSIEANTSIELSVSATTRMPRPNDVEGKDYFFISREKFDLLESDNAFIESAMVHGNKYGTLEEYVNSRLIQGINLILDIDVQGFHQIKQKNIANTSIFIIPPSINELKDRLENRNQDTPEVIDERLKNAIAELDSANEYDFRVLNDNFDMAADELYNLIINRNVQNAEAKHISEVLKDLLSK